MNTSELTGPALDWAVAKCEWPENPSLKYLEFIMNWDDGNQQYSTDWAQGGPIIEREKICVSVAGKYWIGCVYLTGETVTEHAETPLIAAMRVYVASKLGDEIEVN